jgi:hypothetical protein
VEKMAKQKLIFILASVCILLLFAGVLYSSWSTDTVDTPQDSTTNDSITDENANTTTDDSTTDEDTETATDTSANTDHSSSSTTSNFSSTTVAEELANNNDDHEDDEDYAWDSSNVIKITLKTNSISVDVETGIIIDGTTVTITSAGTYSISGNLNDGQIIVDTNDQEAVRLILSEVTISSTTNAPIYVANSDKTVIVLAEGTENYLTDNKNNEENATILSKDDLTICGDGSLTVIGNDNDAIHSNDGLIIESGIITVTSVDDGICGKDYLVIKGGDITVNSFGDGLKSNNDEEEDRGYIYIEDGTITVTSNQGDAITSQTDLLITDGNFTLTSGGGSNTTPDADVSTKGLKAGVSIIVDGGNFTISSSDDAVHSNGLIVINNGTFEISSGDDGIHADTSVEINGGTLDISESFEGIESTVVTVNNGDIKINSRDDGINLVEPTSATSGWNTAQGGFGGHGQGGFGGGGQGGMGFSENCILYINSGSIFIESGGDGIDSNGYIEMSDGILIINGPLSNMNSAIDYGGGSFTISGGTLVAVGSAGMAQSPGASSTQYSANLVFGTQQSANILVNIQSASGEDLLTFCPTKTYQSLVFSSPELTAGTYTVYLGGSSTGTSTNGLYLDGTYSGGTNLGSFTLS